MNSAMAKTIAVTRIASARTKIRSARESTLAR
jgi:hypothetical protein